MTYVLMNRKKSEEGEDVYWSYRNRSRWESGRLTMFGWVEVVSCEGVSASSPRYCSAGDSSRRSSCSAGRSRNKGRWWSQYECEYL